MIKINAIKEGATVTSTSEFTVVKINKKSVIVKDATGKERSIRDRDFNKFNMVGATSTTSTTKSTRKSRVSPAKVGRYPKWANSNPKKQFVMMEREQGKKASLETFKAYRQFQKEQRNISN